MAGLSTEVSTAHVRGSAGSGSDNNCPPAFSAMTAVDPQGKYEEAALIFARAIEIQESTIGANDPALANSLDGRALTLHALVMTVDTRNLGCVEVSRMI